jgi:hypothetical protein
MCENNPDSPAVKPSDASEQEITMQRKRPAIAMYPPKRDGDREQLIAALAAALIAIARQQAAGTLPPKDEHRPRGPNVHTA